MNISVEDPSRRAVVILVMTCVEKQPHLTHRTTQHATTDTAPHHADTFATRCGRSGGARWMECRCSQSWGTIREFSPSQGRSREGSLQWCTHSCASSKEESFAAKLAGKTRACHLTSGLRLDWVVASAMHARVPTPDGDVNEKLFAMVRALFQEESLSAT